ncbi:hypothetical protein I5H99_gp078 [Mycobacterium phage WillSterrel]|uniref:Uncharacterized protein n=2 Tax=Cheoctovirus TaxID=1623281 RepID=A0A1P8DU92_9CAUD|nr:hypothetical protein I5H18_gp074 [Mycobacterium phage Bubbles123]YP_009963471.1 hypothetical protein I5H99_gp078 [Mycobacterium phage WillSterrel]AOQ28531.1 hypothetical protein SEA_WILLSTERREL_78 [Mycobacterium phage WillSterrel]APU93071.1 hypothetical protein SEA_BUBBLES123_74 [Mycobacterium phage Bubbles123]AYQ99593.1 hypothetical protein PBI_IRISHSHERPFALK_79 [Mycobacterium phage IrishSherpFalk]
MNNPELRAVLTEALAGHQPENYGFNCSGCDWEPANPAVTDAAEFAAHQLDVLDTAPGVAVIQLPEPYFEATGDEFENGRKDYAFGDVSVFADGEIHLFGAVWDTAAIEEFAAGILAAVAESKRAAAAAAVVATGEEA